MNADIGIVHAMRMKFFGGLVFLLSAAISTFAFDARDADLAFKAYNNSFYVVSNGFGHYKKNTDGGRSDFWTQAESIEMIEDFYERTGDADARRMITESINGFTNHHSTDWSKNKFNDDLMWMIIACARGYLATSNNEFRVLAKKHFDAVYRRAWDLTLGGGLFWKTDNASKNACVNGPAAIAACLLSEIYHDQSYLTKAKAIYAWERNALFNPASGAVHDNINLNGHIGRTTFTYNEGTFIGAANYLFKLTGETNYLNDALLAANFTRDKISHGKNLPVYNFGDGEGFNGIFLRWFARFANDNHLWPQFYNWAASNANAAWNARRTDNLSWQNWNSPTPDGILDSWACSDAVIILQVVPPKQPIGKRLGGAAAAP
jgi:predicted alpha-1,6-mannanase (GH76 family)